MTPRASEGPGHALLVPACWTVVGVLFTPQAYLAWAYGGRPIGWGAALSVSLADAGLWAALTPAILALAGRLPMRRGSWWYALPLHLLAGALCAALQTLAFQLILGGLSWIPPRPILPVEVFSRLVIYGAVVGAGQAIEERRRYRERELAASRLESRLAQTRLDLLEARIRPHFLFNTLHAVSELMHEDVERADRMVAHLSDLLRLSLDRGARQDVTLEEEIGLLRPYLAIEETRFQERLSVTIDVSESARRVRVPRWILQPLVENAVRHGVSRRGGPGRVEISAALENDRLRLEVRDDGPGVSHGDREAAGSGVGLANVRERLRERYGTDHILELSTRPEGGTRAVMILPARAPSRDDPGGAS